MVKYWFEPHVKADHGVCDSGIRGFGSISLDEKRREDRVIVEHNLATHWARKELVGKSPSLPIPLVASRTLPGSRTRLPGHFFYDQPEIHLSNRNLLAAQRIDTKTIKVWTVSEQSDQKILEKFTVCTDEDSIVLNDQQPSTSKALPAAARQLRIAGKRTNGDLWLRTKAALYLKIREDFIQVFRGGVNTFHENPFLDEVVLCDGRDLVWIGQPGNTFARVKNTCGISSRKLAPTSHPRILFSADDHSLRLLDVRSDNPQTAAPLFQIAEWDKVSSISNRNVISQISVNLVESQPLFDKAKILHVVSMPSAERFCLLVTTRHLIIVDSRFPGQPILTIGHSVEGLVDYVETCPPWKDSVEGGFVYTIYLLSNIPPRFIVVHLYQHENGLWSTLQPPRACRVPRDFFRLCREDTPGPSVDHLFPATRSIAIVSKFNEDMDENLVLTALDDGSLWALPHTHQRLSAKRMNELFTCSVVGIEKYIDSNRHRPDSSLVDLPEEIRPKRKDLLNVVSINSSISEEESKELKKPIEKFTLNKITQIAAVCLPENIEGGSAQKEDPVNLIREEPNERLIYTQMVLDVLGGKPIPSIAHIPSWDELDEQGALCSSTRREQEAMDRQEDDGDEEMIDEMNL